MVKTKNNLNAFDFIIVNSNHSIKVLKKEP